MATAVRISEAKIALDSLVDLYKERGQRLQQIKDLALEGVKTPETAPITLRKILSLLP